MSELQNNNRPCPKYKRILQEQAGAELGQAQVKSDDIVEVVVEIIVKAVIKWNYN